MKPYSKEFRGEVLAACGRGRSTREVATYFNVSESWVRRVKQERSGRKIDPELVALLQVAYQSASLPDRRSTSASISSMATSRYCASWSRGSRGPTGSWPPAAAGRCS